MNQTIVGIDVTCSYNYCPRFVFSGKRRHIGLDGGYGGRWQCMACKKWTDRERTV